MTDPHAYLFAGPIGSGKSTAAKGAHERFEEHNENRPEGEFIEMSDVARAIYNDKDTDLDLSEWAGHMKATHGRAWCARSALEERSLNRTYFVSGIRSPEEIVYFQRYLPTTVIFVWADVYTRFQRHDYHDPHKFIDRDLREWTWGLGSIIENDMYDFWIPNFGSVKGLQQLAMRPVWGADRYFEPEHLDMIETGHYSQEDPTQ